MNNPLFSNHEVAPVMLNREQIYKLLPQINVKAVLQETFLSLQCGNATQPPQTLSLFAQGKGDFITYAGAINDFDVFGAKLSPYLITQEKPIITAWTYLMSQRTGQPLLCCESGLLTVERTAGTTALAVDFLAHSKSKILSIIGSGAIALAHLKHVIQLRSWQEIRVYSPNIANHESQKNAFKRVFPDVVFPSSVSSACENTDVIMLCTSSGTPVIELKDIAPGVLVTSISTNIANAHEVPIELLSQADVYCDYKTTAPTVAGEMKIATENSGWSSETICGDLPELVTDNCRLPIYDKPIYFRSVGLGLEDIAIAYGIWTLLQNESK